MTRSEAHAVDVLLDWVFSKKTHEPAKLKAACELLADHAHLKGARWSKQRVQEERW